jgi:tripartite-type tricarboxylate transporter receptor subunit TctC
MESSAPSNTGVRPDYNTVPAHREFVDMFSNTISAACYTAIACLLASHASAQTPATGAGPRYPTKTIRMIVAAAPGGANDILGRMFAQRMTDALGQTVVVDNRGGGGGVVGAEIVAHAPADGYSLLYCTNSVVVNPSLNPKVSYNMRELAPITMVASFPIALTVHPSVPVKSVPELIALAKKRDGINYGSSGTGSTNHLTGVLLNNVAGVNNVHIPYKGAGPMMTALLSGELEMGITTVFSIAPHVRSGRLRALAVTSLKPLPSLPGVPTVASFYPNFNTNLWHGYFTTAGTPASIVTVLNREIVKALRSPEIRQALEDGGAEAVGNTPAEFAAVAAEDFDKYAKLVKISGAKAD